MFGGMGSGRQEWGIWGGGGHRWGGSGGVGGAGLCLILTIS